jgi:hypothetical protein
VGETPSKARETATMNFMVDMRGLRREKTK